MTNKPNLNNPQAVFDFVVEKLAKQGRKSLGGENYCVYRADNGDRCAFGWLISDEKYVPEMEGTKASVLIEMFDLHEFIPLKRLIGQLQAAHDTAHILNGVWSDVWDLDGIAWKLKNVAIDNKLSPAKVREMWP